MQQQPRIYQKRPANGEQHPRATDASFYIVPSTREHHHPQHHHPQHHHPQHQEHRHYHPAVHGHGPCVHQQQHTAPQHYIQMQHSLAAAEAGAGGDAGVYYTAVPQGYSLLHNNAIAEYVQVAPAAAAGGGGGTTTTATTTSSSISSMLCLSSEMSIPMGEGVVNTSKTTTTTTTHQYDDAMADSTGQRHRRDQNQNQNQKQRLMQTQRRGTHGIAYMIQFGDSEMLQTMSLQDHLQLARPKFCAKSKQRKAILNEMQMLRSERRRELEELLGEDVSLETLDRRLQRLPPPVTSCVRVFTTKEMKAMTSKRCQRLPEVVAAQNREREERRRRGNRLMRDVFNRRMQSRVSKGKISLNHSLTII
ncbi:GL14558 [Drosophila persimilis]|uniref:GL14558 n=1 Tax=Drosophila persimilis TaxID=7234 RepID=B4GW15_DROPE|nr:GL14558 [Drosophila persimilis]